MSNNSRVEAILKGTYTGKPMSRIEQLLASGAAGGGGGSADLSPILARIDGLETEFGGFTPELNNVKKTLSEVLLADEDMSETVKEMQTTVEGISSKVTDMYGSKLRFYQLFPGQNGLENVGITDEDTLAEVCEKMITYVKNHSEVRLLWINAWINNKYQLGVDVMEAFKSNLTPFLNSTFFGYLTLWATFDTVMLKAENYTNSFNNDLPVVGYNVYTRINNWNRLSAWNISPNNVAIRETYDNYTWYDVASYGSKWQKVSGNPLRLGFHKYTLQPHLFGAVKHASTDVPIWNEVMCSFKASPINELLRDQVSLLCYGTGGSVYTGMIMVYDGDAGCYKIVCFPANNSLQYMTRIDEEIVFNKF